MGKKRSLSTFPSTILILTKLHTLLTVAVAMLPRRCVCRRNLRKRSRSHCNSKHLGMPMERNLDGAFKPYGDWASGVGRGNGRRDAETAHRFRLARYSARCAALVGLHSG